MGNKPFSQINLTPMVGVLLALFAVLVAVGGGAPSASSDTLFMTVADPPTGNRPRPPDPFFLQVARDGTVSINGRVVPREAIASEYKRIPAAKRPDTIWVEADMDADMRTVFAVYREIEEQGTGTDIGVVNAFVPEPSKAPAS